MRLLGISEHFAPRVGGTVSYVEQTCAALVARGIEIKLLVPGPPPRAWSPTDYPYEIIWIDAGYPEHGDPSRASRYKFGREAARYAEQAGERGQVDIVHVLFGLFVMEELNTRRLSQKGVPSVATVHNIPPMECARSFEHDSWYLQLKDGIRLKAVSIKNAKRLRRHDYSAYIVPSRPVCEALRSIRPEAVIETIGHGASNELLAVMSPPPQRRPKAGEDIHLLTVGGWVPHKRQHLIPDVAAILKAEGIRFHWTIAGPAGRLSGYKAFVDAAVSKHSVGDAVTTHEALKLDELAKLYDRASIYVQPSTEEGFCITALDAAAAGLPVIGSPAGALPEICAASQGQLVESEPSALAGAIAAFLDSDGWPEEASAVAAAVCSRFSWQQAAEDLSVCYSRLTLGPSGGGK